MNRETLIARLFEEIPQADEGQLRKAACLILAAEEAKEKSTAPASQVGIVGEINKAIMFLRDNRPECKECELYPTGKAERWTHCKYCVWSGCFENHFRKYEEAK